MSRRFGLVLIGFALGLGASAWSTSAQSTIDVQVFNPAAGKCPGGTCNLGGCEVQDALPLPVFHPTEFDLTVADIVDILADYSLVHEAPSAAGLSGGRGYYGYTDSSGQTITIAGRVDRADRRSTILHELTHVKSKLDGLDLDEDAVLIIESALYKKHFGK